MKKNTRKLLLYLYPKSKERFVLPVTVLETICHDTTISGRLSLLRVLEKRGWLLLLEQPDNQTAMSLTSLGRAALEREFSVLLKENNKDSELWTAILFCQSSKRDPQFRNLRRIIISSGGIAVSRGMYIYAGGIPAKIQGTITSIYDQQVSIFTIDQWIFGKDPSLLFDKSGLARIIDLYSSISKEADQLLDILLSEKRLNNKQKDQLASASERLYSTVLEDSTLVHRFYPDAVPLHSVLQKIQQLLLSVFS